LLSNVFFYFVVVTSWSWHRRSETIKEGEEGGQTKPGRRKGGGVIIKIIIVMFM